MTANCTIKVRAIDHVAIALPALGPGADLLSRLFGLQPQPEESVASQQVSVQFLTPDGTGAQTPQATTAIELLAPHGNPSVQRFVDKHGSAMHHICFQVDDLGGALNALKTAGVRLVDESPRRGARGHMVAFIHPDATGGILFELCQHDPPHADRATTATPVQEGDPGHE